MVSNYKINISLYLLYDSFKFFTHDKYFSYQYRTIIIYSFTGLLNEKYHFESIWSPDKLKHYYHSEINNNCKFTRKTSGFHKVFFCFLH